MTAGDDARSWHVAVLSLHRVLLAAAVDGVQASLHRQPFGLVGRRKLLRGELRGGGEPPMPLQLGCRMAADQRRPATRGVPPGRC